MPAGLRPCSPATTPLRPGLPPGLDDALDVLYDSLPEELVDALQGEAVEDLLNDLEVLLPLIQHEVSLLAAPLGCLCLLLYALTVRQA